MNLRSFALRVAIWTFAFSCTSSFANECASSPCQNGGTCNYLRGQYRCECRFGYHGSHCEIDVDECASSPCQNGGTCIDQEQGKYVCVCPSGHTGINCEIDVNECASSPCQNGGTCIDQRGRYVCQCPLRRTGINCETDVSTESPTPTSRTRLTPTSSASPTPSFSCEGCSCTATATATGAAVTTALATVTAAAAVTATATATATAAATATATATATASAAASAAAGAAAAAAVQVTAAAGSNCHCGCTVTIKSISVAIAKVKSAAIAAASAAAAARSAALAAGSASARAFTASSAVADARAEAQSSATAVSKAIALSGGCSAEALAVVSVSSSAIAEATPVADAAAFSAAKATAVAEAVAKAAAAAEAAAVAAAAAAAEAVTIAGGGYGYCYTYCYGYGYCKGTAVAVTRILKAIALAKASAEAGADAAVEATAVAAAAAAAGADASALVSMTALTGATVSNAVTIVMKAAVGISDDGCTAVATASANAAASAIASAEATASAIAATAACSSAATSAATEASTAAFASATASASAFAAATAAADVVAAGGYVGCTAVVTAAVKAAVGALAAATAAAEASTTAAASVATAATASASALTEARAASTVLVKASSSAQAAATASATTVAVRNCRPAIIATSSTVAAGTKVLVIAAVTVKAAAAIATAATFTASAASVTAAAAAAFSFSRPSIIITYSVAVTAKKLNVYFFSFFKISLLHCSDVNRNIDLLLVMENSGSIPFDDFVKQKNFVSRTIDHALTVGCHASVRVAVITYAHHHKIEIDFDDKSIGATPRATLKAAVLSIPYVGGWATDTKVALEIAHSLLHNVSRGARVGAKKIVFVLSSGQSNREDPKDSAAVLKAGATVFAMGATNFRSGSSQKELKNIATSGDHVLLLNRFDDMKDIVDYFGPKARCDLIDLAENRPEDWNSIKDGFKKLKNNSVINDMAALHAETFRRFGTAHNGAGFLPWHRAFLLMIERSLQIVQDDDALRLPYWNWTSEDVKTSKIWDHLGGEQNGDPTDGFCVNTGDFRKSVWHADPSECITRNMITPRPGSSQVSQSTLDADRDFLYPYSLFRRITEGGGRRHNSLHLRFGGIEANMATALSPFDPVFYFHHCFIDLLWFDWQQRWGEGPENYPVEGEVYNLHTPMQHLSAVYPGTNRPLLSKSDSIRPVNLLKVTDLGYTYDSSESIFHVHRRRSETIAADQTQQDFDLQCSFRSDVLSASQLDTCVRRRTTTGVRLASGPNRFEGRVEVLFDGTWHAVCDDDWDEEDAEVVCAQLGFSGGKAYNDSEWAYEANENLASSFDCTGNEELLQDCSHGHVNVFTNAAAGFCPYYGYAQVVCDPGVRLSTIGCSSGYLQVYNAAQKVWGSVCGARNWGKRHHSEACEAAGYGPSVTLVDQSSTSKPILETTYVGCLSSARKAIDCRGIEWDTESCDDSANNLYVSCLDSVRLVDGPCAHEGRVEVFRQGVWGSVGYLLWDKDDGDVVCHQLGYAEGAELVYYQLFAAGPSIVWLDRVQCTGQEWSLNRCRHSGYGEASYDVQRRHAAVKCKP